MANEGFRAVRFEVGLESDEHFRGSLPFSGRSQVNPDSLSIWDPDLIRVFISHRDGHKSHAHKLAKALLEYGFSSFVAHDSIPANEEWRRTIVSGLETMEIMLLFITDDFSDSIWTMQEVGYALGKGVPTVSLKLQKADPPGFVSHTQALRGNINDLTEAALKLAPLIAKSLGQHDRLQTALVRLFVKSNEWAVARRRFDRMNLIVKQLTESEERMIIEGFTDNDQLCTFMYLRYSNRLINFMDRTTGKSFLIEGRNIEEKLPF